MTTTLRFSLPWGLYHATPWNRSANEGAVEWPPSPWRILRALYSAWKVHCPQLSESEVTSVLAGLAGPPAYVLPEFRTAHSRHYMPGAGHREGVSTETAKTLDAFVVTARGANFDVSWDTDLDAPHRATLEELVAGVRYLGRAESVVDISLVPVGSERAPNIVIVEESRGEPSIRLLAPSLPLDVESLVLSPQSVRSSRRLVPPATQWLNYSQPTECVSLPRRMQRSGAAPTVIRLALSGAVLPSRYEAVALGELVRAAVMSKHPAPGPALTGKDEVGARLGGRHLHAHFLAKSGDGRRIDSLIAWAPGGFGNADLAAFESLRHIRRAPNLDSLGTCQVAFVGAGLPADLAPELFEASREWRSITPYSPVGHFRGSLDSRLSSDINRELTARGLPTPLEVELFDGPWLRFRRYRPRKERIQVSRAAYGLVLRFEEPLCGPLALGQLSHFGLGLFGPSGSG